MKRIALFVNGHSATLHVEETAILLDVLREQLDLCSVREGCGVGMCGACTVLVDGKPVSSCLTLAALLDGREVLTLEGLGGPERLHPLQQAFLEHEAFQCGYCTPGFIVATKALLDEIPAPSAEEVRAYLAGNVCRCGAYPEILRAVLARAQG
jgi:xanthine dehydrogenase YagT iron-sulfur-binding subunit